MKYRDFRGNEVDTSQWSPGKINRALRSGRLTQIDTPSSGSEKSSETNEPFATAQSETAAPKTTRKTTRQSTRKSSRTSK